MIKLEDGGPVLFIQRRLGRGNQFFDMYVPKVREVGIDFPDPNLKKDPETGKWSFSDPDWDEFYEVIKGNGPCNAPLGIGTVGRGRRLRRPVK